jgi:hypothetical protein
MWPSLLSPQHPAHQVLMMGSGNGDGAERAWMDLALRVTLAMALLAGGLVVWRNHGRGRWWSGGGRRRARAPPADVAPALEEGGEGAGIFVSAQRLMDFLAALAVASALVSFLGMSCLCSSGRCDEFITHPGI